MPVNPVPERYTTVTPILIVPGAQQLIDFLSQAFGAHMRGDAFTMPDGSIAHSEIEIGDAVVMVVDATDEYPANRTDIQLFVPDVDATYAAALAAGATSQREPADQFYGDRRASVYGPFDTRWNISTHIEDVSPEEMASRMAAMFAEGQPA